KAAYLNIEIGGFRVAGSVITTRLEDERRIYTTFDRVTYGGSSPEIPWIRSKWTAAPFTVESSPGRQPLKEQRPVRCTGRLFFDRCRGIPAQPRSGSSVGEEVLEVVPISSFPSDIGTLVKEVEV